MKKISMTMVSITVLIVFGLATSAVADGFPTIVKTKYGKVEGYLSANNTVSWKGIPFAKPPIGGLRWKEPKKPDKWRSLRQADAFCEMCTQYVQLPSGLVLLDNEDCLYLNVWRPDSKETNLPVYFWIHGGGNSTGSASLPQYDGANLASKGNLIVVTINYRLGPMGWFTHPVLRKDKKKTAKSDSGNYGTLDIIMALKWVRKNIRAFGGDRHNITIAGESAGATNAISLLISPAAEGHFHKAIAQSGPMADSPSMDIGDDRVDEVIDALMEIDGIDRVGMKDKQIANYLRSKTAGEILSLYTPGFGGMIGVFANDEFPNVFKDGTVIHEDGYPEALISGDYNQVPVILGSNKEEHKLFMIYDLYGIPDPYYDFVNPLMTQCEYQLTAEGWSDFFWKVASVDDVANYLIQHQPGDIYAYQFLYGAYNYNTAGDPPDCTITTAVGFNAWPDYSHIVNGVNYGGPNYALWFGSLHSLDIPFFFGTYFFLNPNLTDVIFNQGYSGWGHLSDAMIDYVAQFARAGDPGDAGGEEWEPWSTLTGSRILFDADAEDAIIGMSVP